MIHYQLVVKLVDFFFPRGKHEIRQRLGHVLSMVNVVYYDNITEKKNM